jgi:hypothetical protein
MSAVGNWLGKVVGNWLGDTGGTPSGPTYLDAELRVEGRGSAQMSALGGLVAIASDWLLRARRRLRR